MSTPPDLREDAARVVDAFGPGRTAGLAADERYERFRALISEPGDPTRPDRPGAHLTASAVIVSADRERVLLCLHGRFHQWVQLGGHCEPIDASIADAALREASEESGIAGLRLSPGPVALDIHPVNCRRGGDCLHYDVTFAVIAPAGAVETVSDESSALGWFSPDDLPQPLATGTERIVAAALAALDTLSHATPAPGERPVALRGTSSRPGA